MFIKLHVTAQSGPFILIIVILCYTNTLLILLALVLCVIYLSLCYLSLCVVIFPLYRGQDLLSPTGCFYMVAVEDNDPAQIASVVEGYGVKAEVTNNSGRRGRETNGITPIPSRLPPPASRDSVSLSMRCCLLSSFGVA